MRLQRRFSVLILAALLAFALWLQSQKNGSVLVFALACGLALGVVMQRSRFCFYCHTRDFVEHGKPHGVLALLLAIAVGLLGYTVVLSSWLPNPSSGHLPPDMHIGPVSWVLVLAGLAFGAGMVVSGSCISAHWYRLAEGSRASPFALLGTAIGFLLGFMSWNTLYGWAIADAPVVWLPHHLGYAGSLAVQLGGLAVLAAWVWGRSRKRALQSAAALPERALVQHTETASLRPVAHDGGTGVAVLHVSGSVPLPMPSLGVLWQQLWQGRWPYWLGGLVVGLIGAFAIVRMRPLGVTATLGAAVRDFANDRLWLPPVLHGLDSFAGCATIVRENFLTPNAMVLAGIVGGSFVAALASGQFEWPKPKAQDAARGLMGGVLLGWGAMTALGCTVGNLLSGAQAGALSGWVFGAAMLAAVWLGLKLRQWF